MAKKKVAKKKAAKKVAKKSAKKTGSSAGGAKKSAKKSSGKRELIAPRGDKRFVRRDGEGQFKESDDVGRSLSADRNKKAKRRATAGQGDKGDRKR